MSNEQLEQIELSIENAKKLVSRKDAVNALLDNPQFKTIITDGYFKEEASRLVLLKADQNSQDEATQNYINNSITAIGYLRQYLSAIMQLGNMAENSIASDEATREEILSEALGE